VSMKIQAQYIPTRFDTRGCCYCGDKRPEF
jgi:hypothetical protein